MRLRWDTSVGGVVEKEVKIITIIIKIILHHNQNPKNNPDHMLVILTTFISDW